MIRYIKLYIVFLLIVSGLTFLFESHRLALTFSGFPIDDPYIHCEIAINLLENGTWGLNAGEWSSCSTSPLWTIIVMIFSIFEYVPIVSIQIFGVLLFSLAVLLIFLLSESIFTTEKWLTWVVALLTALRWQLIWAALSGMETIAFMTIILGVFLAIQAGKWRFAAILSGISSLLRPEGVLVLTSIIAARFVKELSSKQVWGYLDTAFLKHVCSPVFYYVLINIPWFIFNLIIEGRILPNTFYAKVGTFIQNRFLFWYYFSFYLVTPLLIIGIAIFFINFISKLIMIMNSANKKSIYSQVVLVFANNKNIVLLGCSLWVFIHTITYAVFLPGVYHHMRYIIPIIPIIVLISIYGYNYIKNDNVKIIIILLCILFSLTDIYINKSVYANNVKIINDLQVKMAFYIKQKTPPNARIATDDLGAICCFSARYVLDLRGLAHQEINTTHIKLSKLKEYFYKNDIYGMAIYAHFYPEIDKLQWLKKEITIYAENNTIAAHSEFSFYRIIKKEK